MIKENGNESPLDVTPRSQIPNPRFQIPTSAHTGRSMLPTLQDSDLLEVRPCDPAALRRGDVIFFDHPGEEEHVVHRVIAMGPDGIRTQGDNIRSPDPWVLRPQDVTGRVVARWRGQKRRNVRGGRMGLAVAWIGRRQQTATHWAARLFGPAYRALARSGWVRCLVPRRFRPRVVLFRMGGRSVPRLVIGRRAVGSYQPVSGRWLIRRPFRLLVNERELERAAAQLQSEAPVTDATQPHPATPDALQWVLDALALQWRDSLLPVPESADERFWQAVKKLALEQNVVGQLYRQLTRRPRLFTRDMSRWLQSAHALALLDIGHWRDEAHDVLEVMRREGVPVLVLKGWALIGALYDDDLGQRLLLDLDVLVSPDDIDQAAAILERLGFEEPDPVPELWPGFNKRFRSELQYYRLIPGRKPLLVELHPRLLRCSFGRIRFHDLASSAHPVTVAGTDATIPAPEDHLVYLCAHLELHHAHELALFQCHDIAALIHHAGNTLNWELIIERAAQWRLIQSVQQALARIERLWPGVVPKQALESIAPLHPTRSERLIHRWVVFCQRTPTFRELLPIPALPGLKLKAQYLLEFLIPSPQYMHHRYARKTPTPLLPAYALRVVLGVLGLVRRI